MSTINFGDVVHAKRLTVVIESEIVRAELNFKAEKKELFVFLYLGVQHEGETMDPIARLHALGWTSPDFPYPATASPDKAPLSDSPSVTNPNDGEEK